MNDYVYRIIVSSAGRSSQYWYDLQDFQAANQVACAYAEGLLGEQPMNPDGRYANDTFVIEVRREAQHPNQHHNITPDFDPDL